MSSGDGERIARESEVIGSRLRRIANDNSRWTLEQLRAYFDESLELMANLADFVAETARRTNR